VLALATLACVLALPALIGCGPRRQVPVDRIEATRDSLRSVPVPRLPAGLASTAFASGLTPAFDAAWVSDELRGRAAGGDAPSPRPLRFTGLAERGPDGWRITAVTYSRPVSDSEAVSWVMSHGAPASGREPDAVPPEAADLARQFRSQTEAGHAPRFAEREDVVALGPGDERGFGPEAARTTLADWWKRGSPPRVTGHVRARLGPAGGSGWVAGDLEQSRHVNGRDVRLPLRAAFAYLRDGRGWKLVQAHLSYRVPEAAGTVQRPPS
jgi:ketosteroid isomerase-like protein